MAVIHGSQAVLKLNDGTSLRDVSGYVTSTGINRMKDLADTTPIGGSLNKTYIPGLKDATIPLEGNYDVTVDGYLQSMYDNTATAAFEFYPGGNTTGQPKLTGSFLLSSYNTTTAVGDKGTISAEVQISGAITRTIV